MNPGGKVVNLGKKILVFCLLALLASCGVGEFLIKRSVLKMEGDIAKEFKSYADFSDEQEADIDEIARSMTVWMRGVRLPLFRAELEQVAGEIEKKASLGDTSWRSFVSFMEDPFVLSEAPGLLDQMSKLVHGMTERQIEQATRRLSKNHKEKKRELEKITPEGEVDKIIDGLKAVFKDIGIKRSRSQLKQARKMLAKREAYIDLEKQAHEENHRRFVELLRNRGDSLVEFQRRFTEAWLVVEISPKENVPERWEHNLKVSHEMMNFLLSDLNQEQRLVAAASIRNYALLFDELSRFE